MKEINVTIGQWYVVEGAAGDTITNPSTGRAIATVEEGKQASFYATSAVVVASSDSVQVHRANFKSAPAKLKLLGLLGGGSTTTLPAGYIAAEFLDFNNTDGSFTTDFVPVGWTHFEQVSMGDAKNPEWSTSGWIANAAREFRFYYNNNGWNLINEETFRYTKDRAWNSNLDPLKRVYVVTPTTVTVGENTTNLALVGGYTYDPVTTPIVLGKSTYNACYGRLYNVTFYNAEQKIVDLIPCLLADGRVAIVDRVTEKLYPTETFTGIVGLSLEAARNLKLPATGGTLTISLPEGYEADEGVANALETARSNGWTLTIQTHTPETTTVMARTFAFRRVWVRRTQDEQGAYVSADGSRWLVEWCVDMLTPDGSTPDQHGYELFRSTEAAVAYWELESWIDPEVEELLTNSTTNEHE